MTDAAFASRLALLTLAFATLVASSYSLTFGVARGAQISSEYHRAPSAHTTSTSLSRRSLVSLIASGPLLVAGVQGAEASGGATAGGAYLRSAKQRYNERVVQGAKSFVALSSESPADPAKIKAWYEDEDGWKDFSSAGYLLANAFRRSSSTAPDKLPSVQKWKLFAKEVDAIGKKPKTASFDGAKAALNDFLEEVELTGSL